MNRKHPNLKPRTRHPEPQCFTHVAVAKTLLSGGLHGDLHGFGALELVGAVLDWRHLYFESSCKPRGIEALCLK